MSTLKSLFLSVIRLIDEAVRCRDSLFEQVAKLTLLQHNAVARVFRRGIPDGVEISFSHADGYDVSLRSR